MNINNETPAALEAILFACGGPVAFDRLCEILGINSEGLREAAAILKNKYADDRESGIQLITVESAYQLCTKAYVAEYVKKALELRKAPPLSKASLEVLAIIAYNQPVTRSFIEMVRGVDSSAIVASLVDKGLVAERGTLDAPGRPVLFGTTDAFLDWKASTIFPRPSFRWQASRSFLTLPMKNRPILPTNNYSERDYDEQHKRHSA